MVGKSCGMSIVDYVKSQGSSEGEETASRSRVRGE